MARMLNVDDIGNFVDSENRVVVLRGINIDGSSKLPKTPDTTTFSPQNETFWQGNDVSFIGRPFSLEDAPAHLERLKSWGYNTIRYVYSWEAIEHKGPGIYDDEFIDFTIEVLKIISYYGFYVFLDPHQDVWGRYSGGSGAPLWTYYAAGYEPRSFAATEGAILQNSYEDPLNEYPKMLWATNYYRNVSQTMFTLFFAGKHFAPRAIINGENIEDYLQNHMLQAMLYFYQRIKDNSDLFEKCILGVETMNEPHLGLIGFKDIGVLPHEQNLRLGTSPTAYEGMLLSMGIATKVDNYVFTKLGPKKAGRVLVDPKGVTSFVTSDNHDVKYGFKRHEGWQLGKCVWAQHGVWDTVEQKLLKPNYFDSHNENSIDESYFVEVFFAQNYWKKFYQTFRAFSKEMFIFCQPPTLAIPPALKGTDLIDKKVVYAPHFYDGITLMLKKWNPYWNVDCLGYLRGKYAYPFLAIKLGEKNIRAAICDELKTIRKEGLEKMGNIPCLMSETGMPMDMNDKASYSNGDYHSQTQALDAITCGLEAADMHFTLWGYTCVNSHVYGDYWNGEDFSLWSPDGSISKPDSDTDSKASCTHNDDEEGRHDHSSCSTIAPCPPQTEGVRGVEAVIRPYPLSTYGTIKSYSYDIKTKKFILEIEGYETLELSKYGRMPSEIWLPSHIFQEPLLNLEVTAGKTHFDPDQNVLYWWNEPGYQKLMVSPNEFDGPRPEFTCNCTIA